MSRRVAVYIRQSQYHDQSISEELQRSTCEAYAQREGWTVVGVHKDIDLSGRSTEKREGLKALRASFDAGEFDLALAHSVSRFSRDMRDGAGIIAEMPIATVLEGEALPDDDFMPLLHMLLGHKQSREIGKRWKETQERRVSLGLPPRGGMRFGYLGGGGEKQREQYGQKAEGLYRPDPDLVPYVKGMYERYINGAGMVSLAKWLNEEGILTSRGNQFTSETISEYMDDGFAAGILRANGQVMEGSWEPIISREIYDQYVRIRAERRKLPKKAQQVRWHLAGIIRCGRCGGPVVGNGGKPENPGIACSRRIRGGATLCEGVWGRRFDVNKRVSWWLGGHIDQWAAATPLDAEKRAQAEARAEKARLALEAAQTALGRLAEGWATGVLDDDGYRLARASQEEKRDAAQAERDAALAELDTMLPADADPFAIIEAAGDLDAGQWNGVLTKIIDRIEVHPGGRLLVVDSHGEEAWLDPH